MKTICLVLLFALLAIVYAAPAPAPAPAGNDPTVSVLNYRNEVDLDEIQRLIIADYQKKYGGTTQIHAPRVANAVNPQRLNFKV